MDTTTPCFQGAEDQVLHFLDAGQALYLLSHGTRERASLLAASQDVTEGGGVVDQEGPQPCSALPQLPQVTCKALAIAGPRTVITPAPQEAEAGGHLSTSWVT